MNRLKVLSAAAVMALVLPVLVPQASLAQAPGHPGASRGGGHPGLGMRPGGGGPRYNGGGYRGGGGYHGGGNGALIGGAIAGAVIGGAIASQGYGPGYYAAPGPGYYDEGYDDGAVAVAPAPGGGDDVAY